MIVATEDNTQVGVYYTDNGIAIEDENITLQTHQVFTKDCYHLDGQPLIDFTGTRVVATKAVSVYSGNGLADISAVVCIVFQCANVIRCGYRAYSLCHYH